MPDSGQLYAVVEEGRTAQAAPPQSLTSSSTGRMTFSIELPRPASVLPVRLRIAAEEEQK